MNTIQQTTLYYRAGNSDKVYQVAVEPAGERYVVNFAYGRRGSTLSTGTKTNVPVDHARACAIFDQLVREKTAKGYTPGESGTPYQHTANAGRNTGIVPMLLNPIEAEEVANLIHNPDWCLQEKFDGRRVLIQKTGDQVIGINRRGLAISLPLPVLLDVACIHGDFILDGESIGDRVHAFDLLELDGEDLRPQSLSRRLVALMNLLASAQCPNLPMVESAFTPAEKGRKLTGLKTQRSEGVVFKRLDAPYVPGRPNSGGTALKHKFVAMLSAVVARVNEQRSVSLRLRGHQGWQNAGNVTIPANHPVPQAGDIVEVRYLYAFPESGVLFQPVYLGRRTDVTADECVTTQLKFKASEEDEN